MAKALTEEESKALRKESLEAEKKKRVAQSKQGKEFVNHGQGVMPEETWTNLPGKKEEENGSSS